MDDATRRHERCRGGPPLETTRLTLRRSRDDDADRLLDIFGDAEVMRFVGRGPPLDGDAPAASQAAAEDHWREHLFGPLGLGSVVAVVYPGKAASRRVVERLGFRAVGEGRHYGSLLLEFELGHEEWRPPLY